VLHDDAVRCRVLQRVAVRLMRITVCLRCPLGRCAAMCCSVLQGVAGCCSVLQCVAVCCSVLQSESCATLLVSCVRRGRVRESLWQVCCTMLQRVAGCCSVLQCVAVCCSVLQCAAVCCSVLQCVAVCCSKSHVQHCLSPESAGVETQRQTQRQNVCLYLYFGSWYGVATISRLLKMIGLFCKRAL